MIMMPNIRKLQIGYEKLSSLISIADRTQVILMSNTAYQLLRIQHFL